MFPGRRMRCPKEPSSGFACCRISTPYAATPNTPFSAKVTQDIMRNGKVVVPVGSELHGRVVYATSGNRLHGGSVLHLRADEFVLPDGTRYHVHAQVIDTMGSDTNAKGEGNIVANAQVKRNLAVLGAGAGGGAIVGAAMGAESARSWARLSAPVRHDALAAGPTGRPIFRLLPSWSSASPIRWFSIRLRTRRQSCCRRPSERVEARP